MKNKKLSKIEKLIRLVNEKYKITYDEIYEIKIDEFENETLIGIRKDKFQEYDIYTITRKNFEDKYKIKW